MHQRKLLNLEELLERLGSDEIPGDTHHRYALRRALLNSKYFEANLIRHKFYQWFTLGTSLLAGGAVVAVFIVFMNVGLGSNLVLDDALVVEDNFFESRPLMHVKHKKYYLVPDQFFQKNGVEEIFKPLLYIDLQEVFHQNVDLAFTQ